MRFDFDDYSGMDDSASIPLLVSERSQGLILAAMAYLQKEYAWVDGIDPVEFNTIDEAVSTAISEVILEVTMDGTPVGTIAMYAHHTTLPDKWLFCDGTELLIADYPELYASFGWAYGSPSDSDHFKLPNLRNRFPYGADSSVFDKEVGNSGGAETHALTVAEIPAHAHTFSSFNNAGAGGTNVVASGSSGGASTKTSSSVGSGNSHNNMPPFLRVEYIIKALP